MADSRERPVQGPFMVFKLQITLCVHCSWSIPCRNAETIDLAPSSSKLRLQNALDELLSSD
eukprot:1133151-Pelagomonas_calceolata.AAC.1